MIRRTKRLKRIRIHHGGTDSLIRRFIVIVAIALLLRRSSETRIPFYTFTVTFGTICCIVIDFLQCPIRYFPSEDTDRTMMASADSKVAVVEKVEENKYFHGKRPMTSAFTSLFNIRANWFPADGKVKLVHHQNGNYYRTQLPRISEENEHSDIIIIIPDGVDVLCRQTAGVMARRIATYAREGEDCYIDERLGFIKLGSRIDVYLPIRTKVCVKMGQKTTDDHTAIAELK